MIIFTKVLVKIPLFCGCFWLIWGLILGSVGSGMCGVASPGVNDMGRSAKLGLGEYFGVPQYDFIQFSKVQGNLSIWGCFQLYYRAMMGLPGSKIYRVTSLEYFAAWIA